MRWISIINCLLIVSLVAVAEPNGRNKRDFTFLKNLVQKILYGNNEINIELAPSSEEEATQASKFKLYELPGYEDVLIKVPVNYGETYPEEIPVNLNAFGSTVGTKTSGNTFDAMKDVNNLVSSGILNENHDKTLKGALGNMFPNSSEESESNEEEIKNASEAKMGEPVHTKGTENFDDIDDLKKPVELINPYNQAQNEEFPMRTAHNYPGDKEIETIEANSYLPNCDQLRVDSGFLIPANQYQVAPAPETYPAPSFVNVFYPNLPADKNIQNLLYPPRITDKDHQSHHKHPGHHHYSHHHSHHGRLHHHHHHLSPHHHLHTKLNETSPTGNGTILNDEIEGSTPSSLKPEESTTEDPVNYRVQFVSRLTNTETFQGMNMGQTVQDTNRSNYTGDKDNPAYPIAANYGSNQFVYRNQDNLKMVTFEDKLKNHTNTKEPINNDDSLVTNSKDQEFAVKPLSNVTADQNNENSLTSTERIRIEDRLTPERSRKNHVHHHSSRYTPKTPHHHRHHHRHHHAINHHPLHFHTPQTFGLNENSNNVPNGMAPEDIMPDEVPTQRFGDELKTNVNTTNDTDAKVLDNYVRPVTDSTDSKEKFGVKENTFPSDTADQSNTLHYPMSTDKGDTGIQDALLPELIKNVHFSHRSRHPSRTHGHHHRRGHHSHLIGWRHQPKYVHLPGTFDSDALKSMMNANTLFTNKVTENPVTSEESATELYENKLKENEWKSNEKPQITGNLNGNSTEFQNNTGGEPMRGKGSNDGNSKSKNRGDIPDE